MSKVKKALLTLLALAAVTILFQSYAVSAYVQDVNVVAGSIEVSSGDIAVTSSVLPTGAATGAKQDSQTALLTTISSTVATGAKQDTQTTVLSSISTDTGSTVTELLEVNLELDAQTTSLSSIDSSLSDVATSTLQTTGNASLSSIDGKLTNNATSTLQTTGNASLSSIDGKLTSTTATSALQTTGNASLSSIDGKLTNNATSTLQTTGNASLSSIDGKTPALGQAAMAASMPVTIASNQSSFPVAYENTTVDGTLGALNATVQISGEGASSVEWLVGPGLSGTIVFEESSDGSNWSACTGLQQNTTAVSGLIAASIATFNVRGKFIPSGKNFYRLRVSAYTSGSLAARLIASQSVDVVRAVTMGGILPDDAIVASVPPVFVGGRASTAAPSAVSTDGDMVATWHDRRGAYVMVGDIANAAADSGNPVKVGSKAAVSALPTAVTDAQRVDSTADRYGRDLVSHIDPGLSNWKGASYTTAQTGTNLWVPAAGKRLAITSLAIATGGTTAGRVTVWSAVTADTTYTEGTDQVYFDGDFIPSATLTQQVIIPFPVPAFSNVTIACLKVTTSANITVRISAYGYEYTP